MSEEKDENKYTNISIPTSLAEKIKKRIEGTGFISISSYVTFVLTEVILEIEKENDNIAFSKEDEERIKTRLRALGYLD